MIAKTEAIVLKAMKYRDTSRIVTFYTERFGKIKGIAKGARSLKSKFGSSLEPLSHVQLVLYKKEHVELHLISQADLIQSLKKIQGELPWMAPALAVIELTNQLVHDEEQHPALFRLLADTLTALDGAERNQRNFFLAFELRLCPLFGFAMNLDRCIRCERPLAVPADRKALIFRPERGGMLCDDCTAAGGRIGTDETFDLTVQSYRIMQRLLSARTDSLGSLELPDAARNEIGMLLRLYIGRHTGGLKPLKSERLFAEL